jgi:hypothetical protein
LAPSVGTMWYVLLLEQAYLEFFMVTTRLVRRGVVEENMREEAGASHDPQVEINHLREKVAQLERELSERDHTEQQETQGDSLRGDPGNPTHEGPPPERTTGEESSTEGNVELTSLIKKNEKEKKEWAEKLAKLEQQCDYLMGSTQSKAKGKALLADSLFSITASPFTDQIMSCQLPGKFRVPEIPAYTGLGDPIEHLASFRAHTVLHATPDEVACRAFPLTLAGGAREWFRTLPPRSISNFEGFAKKFASQFMAGVVRKKPA